MGGRPSDEHSIERKDNNKGYSPENCIWVDKTTQVLNRRLNKNNTSGVKGVTWNKARKKWLAVINVDYKVIQLGGFVNKEDVIVARKEAEVKYWGREMEY